MQGETLEQQFGEQEVCFRTLDLYTSAVLESSLNPVVQPRAEFRTAMDEMAKVGSASPLSDLQTPCSIQQRPGDAALRPTSHCPS